LEVHQIRQRNRHNRQRNTLCSNMIREQLRIEHDTRDIDAKTINNKKHIEGGYTDAESGFVGASLGVLRDHGCFDAQANHAAENAKEHERAAPESIHDPRTEEICRYAPSDPPTLENQLVASAETEGFVERWSLDVLVLVRIRSEGTYIIVNHQNSGRLSNKCEDNSH
jgi:predicted glycosyl hydrolase (DUF1957 family)